MFPQRVCIEQSIPGTRGFLCHIRNKKHAGHSYALKDSYLLNLTFTTTASYSTPSTENMEEGQVGEQVVIMQEFGAKDP